MTAPRVRLDLVSGSDLGHWVLRADGVDVGRLETARSESEESGVVIAVAVFVDVDARRRGIARAAVGRLLGAAHWGHDVRYVADIAAGDHAAESLARRLGFSVDESAGGARRRWSRAAPAARAAADDVRRFLDGTGRIDRYPLRASERRDLLAWVAQRALPAGIVLDEAAVNALLAPYAPAGDVAVLRRYLVDHELVERTRSGSEYLRLN